MKTLTATAATLIALALIASPDAYADLKVKSKVSQVKAVDKKTEISTGKEKTDKFPEDGFSRIRLGTVSKGALINAKPGDPDPLSDDFADEEDARAKTEIGVIKDSIVSGKVKQTVTVDDSTNIARGAGSTAVTRIGVIRNSIVSGTVEQTTHVGSNVNIAAGGGTAITDIGVIDGSSISGEVDQSVFVDRIRNIAD